MNKSDRKLMNNLYRSMCDKQGITISDSPKAQRTAKRLLKVHKASLLAARRKPSVVHRTTKVKEGYNKTVRTKSNAHQFKQSITW